MEWQPEVKELYDNVVLRMPEMVRPVIKPQLLQKAEIKCEERRGKKVAEIDLIVALFEITPTAFQPTMIEDLKTLKVDYDRYLAKVKADFKCSNDLEQMIKDFAKLCEITEVNFNENAVRKVFDAYKKFFIGAPISIRTTTKPVERRDVALRYVEFFMPHNPDPYTTAINEGLIVKDDHPIHEMIQEVMETFQLMGYGVDVDANTGLSKIWVFIYFMLKQPPKAKYDNCVALVEELGFELAIKEAMEGSMKAVHLNYTFSWDSENIERFCFGIEGDDPKEIPVHLHPLMKKFVNETPLQSDSHKFLWGVAFTRNGLYYKIENDYNGAMIDFLGMGCKAGLETYK